MKRIFFLIVLPIMAVSCSTGGKLGRMRTEAESVRIGTYNLWRSDIGKGDYAWEVRKDRLARSIAEIGFDVFGVQELNLTIQQELPGLLAENGAPEYVWYIFSPYSEDGKGDRAQAILFRKDRFTLVEAHKFWISPTPEVKSKGWDEVRFYRGGCCVTLKDKRNGKEFFVIHSHFPLAKQAHTMAADVIISQAMKYNKKNLPAFFIGDLNVPPTAESSKKSRSYWTDSFMALPDEAKEGPSGTFNGHDADRDMSQARRIDYVYFRGDVTPVKYHCFDKKYDGLWPSDHCAVFVDMKY